MTLKRPIKANLVTCQDADDMFNKAGHLIVLTPEFTKQFHKYIKRLSKRRKDMAKFKAISSLIINEQPLAQRNKDHILIGNHVGRRECHIEPDWLLIYKIEAEHVVFERTGSHSDLFKYGNFTRPSEPIGPSDYPRCL